MPFPKISNCIVCEAIRQEAESKLTILGFYGVCPNLSIKGSDRSKNLTFLLIADSLVGFEGGRYDISAILKGPEGSVIAELPTSSRTFGPVRKDVGFFLASNFGDIVLKQSGTYTFVVIVDNLTIASETFSVY